MVGAGAQKQIDFLNAMFSVKVNSSVRMGILGIYHYNPLLLKDLGLDHLARTQGPTIHLIPKYTK